MNTSNPLRSLEFHAQLMGRGCRWLNTAPTCVQGDVILDGSKDMITDINLGGITFTGVVTMCNITGGYSCILNGCHFLGGLQIEALDLRCVSISDSTMKWLHMWRCKLDSVFIGGTIVERTADISGLNLSDHLRLVDSKLPTVELVHSSTHGRIMVPAIETDDPVLAFQFRMAGIPVFMSSAGARELMRIMSRADELLTK